MASLNQIKDSKTNDVIINEDKLSKPIIHNGRFKNPWSTWKDLTLVKVSKFQFFTSSLTNLPCNETLNKTLPLHLITDEEIQLFCKEDSRNRIKVIWIGHSTCLVNLENKIILMDPVFSQRCSPSSSIGPKRYVDVPITIDRLPRVDAVVISHNHYDHFDYQSILNLHQRFGKMGLTWFVGLGLKEWFIMNGIYDNIFEMTWWQEIEFNGLTYIFTPAQHWSNRKGFDINRSLWGSWTIIGSRKRIFFAGDTGYCTAFTEIGNKYGPFDLSFIPIGAYHPRSILSPQHVDPEQAVKIHLDIKSNKSLAIHWGTFALGKEHYLSPKEELQIALDKLSVERQSFIAVSHGEIYKY